MKRIAVAGLAAGLSWSAMAEELPLKSVVLSTAGLAQFTHAGEVSPGTTIALSVRLDQVDDLLKSLTIFDEEGAIGTISLPGKEPLAELFRDLPFGPDALTSLPALLNALIGSEVEIDGSAKARGRLVSVKEETVQLPDNGGQTLRHRVTLMTEGGLVQVMLEDLAAVRFADANARAQIEHALAGIAQNRAKERRTLSIDLLGEKARQAGFSYVVAAPVWKTAYRLVLPPEAGSGGGKVRLQGWGIVENLTGSDWKAVDLSLISGNPVALKQPLYTAFYLDRPEVPIEASSRIVPRKDDVDGQPPPPSPQAAATRGRTMYLGQPKAGLADESDSAGAEEKIMVQFAFRKLAAEAEEASTQVHFRFPEKISLANGSTMMVPFVDHEIAAERSWLYQPETNDRHPLAAVRLKNDSATALPAGIITAFDTNAGSARFVGDARMPLMPRGESKFVTFALDSKTAIRRTDRGQKHLTFGKAVNGVLTTRIEKRWNIDYEITPPVDEARDVIIDEVRPSGWTVAKDLNGIEQTAARLRYKVSAPAGQTTKATLGLERVEEHVVTLATYAPRDLLVTLRGLENESQTLKQAIADLGILVADISRIEGDRKELEAERDRIGVDQARIRENLKSVGASSDLGRRYLEALNKQEDRLDAISDTDNRLDQDLATKRRDVEALAKTLAL